MIMFAQYVQGSTFTKAVKMAETVTDLAKRCAAADGDNPDCLKPLVSLSILLIWHRLSNVTYNFRVLVHISSEKEHIIRRCDLFVYRFAFIDVFPLPCSHL